MCYRRTIYYILASILKINVIPSKCLVWNRVKKDFSIITLAQALFSTGTWMRVKLKFESALSIYLLILLQQWEANLKKLSSKEFIPGRA